MIDEELYKKATDELNSDQRKPDVWARACALASDDHDEARFLYTNLRVEEMLNTEGKQRTFNAERVRDQQNLNAQPKLDTLELGLDDSDITESSRMGVDSVSAPLPIDDIVGLDGDNTPAPSSVSGNAVASDSTMIGDDPFAEIDAIAKDNADISVVESSLTGKATSTTLSAVEIDQPEIDFESDSGDVDTTPMVAELVAKKDANNDAEAYQHDAMHDQSPPLDTESVLAETPIQSPEQQRASELANNLEKQADSLAESDEFDPVTITAEPGDADTVLADYADFDVSEANLETETGPGRSFLVFERSGTVKAVKRGVSWPAMLFTFPWLLGKQLFGTAIVYGVLWLVTVGGLLITASQWAAMAPDAGIAIKIWTLAFALLTLVGLFYLPFKYGNRWVAEKLQNRGFELKSAIGAGNKRDAIDQLLQHND